MAQEPIGAYVFGCGFPGARGIASVKNKNKLLRIVNLCSKIIGEPQRNLSDFCVRQIERKALSIISDPNHALNREFELLPSGRHFRSKKCSNNRHLKSFVPKAIRLLNGEDNNDDV